MLLITEYLGTEMYFSFIREAYLTTRTVKCA